MRSPSFSRRSSRFHLIRFAFPLLSACGGGIPDMHEARLAHAMSPVFWQGTFQTGHRPGVLITGGAGDNTPNLQSAEVFDATTRTFWQVGRMHAPRTQHAQVLIQNPTTPSADDAFVEGGSAAGAEYVEYFNSDQCAFARVAQLRRRRLHAGFTAVASGKLLVTGGNTFDLQDHTTRTSDATAELVEIPSAQLPRAITPGVDECQAGISAPVDNAASSALLPTGTMIPMQVDRVKHTATLLISQNVATQVLLVGGNAREPRAETFDIQTRTFRFVGAAAVPRWSHTASVLHDGSVLIAGGSTVPPSGSTLTDVARAELYDPASGQFVPTGVMVTPRTSHTSTSLTDGRVLIAGGRSNGQGVLRTTELYDPATRTFTRGPDLQQPRMLHAAILLATGEVLITGGTAGSAPLKSAELVRVPPP